MIHKVHGWKKAALAVLVLIWCCSLAALAEGLSGDNSLSSLGIATEGATVSPEFLYSTIEYNVTVPAGTTELSLSPVTSNSSATITDISGTTLDENGETTVVISVMAENGSAVSYYLYVTSEQAVTEAPAETEPQTEPPTEAQTETEPETEDPRYVRVDRNSLEEAENTIETLKTETANYRDRVNLLMRILYGLIAFCVVLLFVVINLILKKKDLKAELKAYRSGTAAGTAEYDAAGYAYPYPEEQYQEQQYQEQGSSQSGREKRRSRKKARKNESEYDQQYDGAPEETLNGPGWESEAEGQMTMRMEAPAKRQPAADDPATVPKAAKSRKKPKKLPEYEQPAPAPEYQAPSQTEKKDVEVTMIDL